MRQEALVIDWTNMITYNTLMALAAGAGLVMVAQLAWRLATARPVDARPWAAALAVPGILLTATGLHMTLTWPLAAYFPFDDIIFGEPSLAFGVLLLVASFVLWRGGEGHLTARTLARFASPLTVLSIGIGLACIAIAFAGVIFKLFAAPPEEPISGLLADYPMVEATFISVLYALVGVGAIAFPFAARELGAPSDLASLTATGDEDAAGRPARDGAPAARPALTGGWTRTLIVCFGVAGIVFVLFGALNYFTHIGLIVHTMPSAG